MKTWFTAFRVLDRRLMTGKRISRITFATFWTSLILLLTGGLQKSTLMIVSGVLGVVAVEVFGVRSVLREIRGEPPRSKAR